MSTPGRARQRLAGILSSAFAEGLLSEQTHAYRLEQLFSPQLVDEQRLIGDLRLRRAPWSPLQRMRDACASLARGARTWMRHERPPASPLLLGLDWRGTEQLLVGRAPGCDVLVAHPTVSRRHAQLTFRDGVWVIQDLASKNGTSVNGVPVGRMALRAGDLVTLGGQPIQID